MAEVTVYDATRMKAIEDNTVVNGEINPVNGHLELVRFDETVIDAGLIVTSPRVVTSATRPVPPDVSEGVVIYETDTNNFWVYDGANWQPRGHGTYICTSTTRPATPFTGMRIYETNTDLDYMWTGTAWRRHPWKSAWGAIARYYSTVDSPSYSAAGNSDMQMLNVSARADRLYAVHLNVSFVLNAAAQWSFDLRVDAASVGRFGMETTPNITLGDTVNGKVLWLPATTATFNLYVRHEELGGTATLIYQGAASFPRMFWVEDIGPRVP